MELDQAQKIADEVVKRLSPFCKRIEVAGSIRRKKPLVRDIDLIIILSDPWNLHQAIMSLGQVTHQGGKIQRVLFNGIQIDIYFATTETWATLLLIRTGSKENNIRLCTHAKNMGWHLSASGDGLFDKSGNRIAGDTEESIFKALGLPYQNPEDR